MSTIETLRTELATQIQNYALPPYIYTYPPKGAYQPFTDSEAILNSWKHVTGPLNIYIHIPFCEMKCSFCDLFTTISKNESFIDQYVHALIDELALLSKHLPLDNLEIVSIYFGGGTPSLLSHAHLNSILEQIKKVFHLHPQLDLSIEGTPDSFTSQKLSELKSLGFTRLSIGIESFNAQELKDMGRHYPAAISETVLQNIEPFRFNNVNIDLIYGFPGQTFQSWQNNLTIATAAAINTITAYSFVKRNRTSYGKQLNKQSREDKVANELVYQWYDFTVATLEQFNFQQLTSVTFAKPSGGCLHEQNEFHGIPTLALGTGSRSYAPHFHYTNDQYVQRVPNKILIKEYIESIAHGKIPVKSAIILKEQERQLRYVILALLSTGIQSETFFKHFNVSIFDNFGHILTALQLEGLVDIYPDRIQLSKTGRRYSNIIGNFLASNDVKQVREFYA